MPHNASYLNTPGDSEDARRVFGEKVESIMRSLGMNQSQLAVAAGLRRDAISTYVRGKTWPSPENLLRVAGALHVIPGDLIPGVSEIQAARTRPVLIPRSGNDKPGISFTILANDMANLVLNETLPASVAIEIVAIIRKTNAQG